MSYRELRNFCEIMRSLGYPRLISIENFLKPNFELVADILYWLAMRYDPQAEISDDIDEERHRVEFIKQIATLFATKTRIKLNCRKLYGSDGYAVQEILKVATVLYKAYNAPPGEEDYGAFTLPSKLSNIKTHKATANEITEIGAKLYDSLQKENDLKVHRDKALSFLDNISSNFQSNSEQQYIEKCVKDIIAQQDDNIQEAAQYITDLEKNQRSLEEKIKKKTIDLDRAEKKIKILQNSKPAYMEEYLRLESELEKIYEVYIEKFRNLDYLEHQLDNFNKIEEKKFQISQEKQKRERDRIQENEMRILRGEQEIDENDLENQIANQSSRGQSRGDSRGMAGKGTKQGFGGEQNKYGNLEGPNEEDEEEEEESNEGSENGEEEEEGQDLDDDDF